MVEVEGEGEGESERCGSVTDLLMGTVDLYEPPSPRHHPPPDPDCWGETARAPKHDKDKITDTSLNISTPAGDAQTDTNGLETGQLEDRSKAREQNQNPSRDSDAKSPRHSKVEEAKILKEKNKPGMKQRKAKPGGGPDQSKSRGAATEKVRPGTKSDKTLLRGAKTAEKGKQGTADPLLLPPPRPRPGG